MKMFGALIRGVSFTAAASLLGAAAIGQTVPPAAAITAAPAGNWNLDYGKWQCVLKRDLTSGGQPAYFSLALEPLSATALFTVGVRGSGDPRNGEDAIMLADGKRLAGTVPYKAYAKDQDRVREYSVDMKRQDLGAVDERVRFWTRSDGDVEAQLPGFQPAWAALNKCMSDFYRDLGITRADLAQVAKPPEGKILSSIDLPAVDELDFAMFFWIDSDGRIKNCRLLKPSGIAKLDQSLCTELEAKARLTPARNAAGDAVRVPHFEHVHLEASSDRD